MLGSTPSLDQKLSFYYTRSKLTRHPTTFSLLCLLNSPRCLKIKEGCWGGGLGFSAVVGRSAGQGNDVKYF